MTELPRFTRDRLEALLKKMAGQRIVVVGDAMLDIYLEGNADRISPEAPVPVVTVHTQRYALGGAANVAANVAASAPTVAWWRSSATTRAATPSRRSWCRRACPTAT